MIIIDAIDDVVECRLDSGYILGFHKLGTILLILLTVARIGRLLTNNPELLIRIDDYVPFDTEI